MASSSKDNLHRETLRTALRVIQTSGTLEEARIRAGADAQRVRQAGGEGDQG